MRRSDRDRNIFERGKLIILPQLVIMKNLKAGGDLGGLPVTIRNVETTQTPPVQWGND